jgi:membrane protein DedA with SNARE-associated domain
MNHALQFLMNHEVAVLFVCVLAEQFGLPIPSVPALLAAGLHHPRLLKASPVVWQATKCYAAFYGTS